jgi:Fe-S cluster assembly protein SufB
MTGEATLEHEAYVSRIGEEQILYLMSRGLTAKEAEGMIIRGFLEPIMAELPMEYAVELNRLVKMEMTGSVG